MCTAVPVFGDASCALCAALQHTTTCCSPEMDTPPCCSEGLVLCLSWAWRPPDSAACTRLPPRCPPAAACRHLPPPSPEGFWDLGFCDESPAPDPAVAFEARLRLRQQLQHQHAGTPPSSHATAAAAAAEDGVLGSPAMLHETLAAPHVAATGAQPPPPACTAVGGGVQDCAGVAGQQQQLDAGLSATGQLLR